MISSHDLGRYLKMILCHGANIGAMRRAPDAESNEELKRLEAAAHADLEAVQKEVGLATLAATLCHAACPRQPSRRPLRAPPHGTHMVSLLVAQRFPVPEVFECEQYASKARYLVQKLNPDVPLNTFLQGLYQAVVS